jgi:four helix bundle protein
MFNIDWCKLQGCCKAKSEADFVNKLKITEEEADEANYFLDVIASVEQGRFRERLAHVLEESGQLAAIYAKSVITMKSRINARSKS